MRTRKHDKKHTRKTRLEGGLLRHMDVMGGGMNQLYPAVSDDVCRGSRASDSLLLRLPSNTGCSAYFSSKPGDSSYTPYVYTYTCANHLLLNHLFSEIGKKNAKSRPVKWRKKRVAHTTRSLVYKLEGCTLRRFQGRHAPSLVKI